MDKLKIVLVHGAFGDGSGWCKVLKQLREEGHCVIAAQNPLSSFANDVETTNRLVDMQNGPVILVGHSYGGMVITAVANINKNVKGLVYVCAAAPDKGESLADLLGKEPTPGSKFFTKDKYDRFWIDNSHFSEVFAHDCKEAPELALVQNPISLNSFTGKLEGTPAWKSIPSWYVLGEQDNAINPITQKFMSERIKAKVTRLPSSHASMVSHPMEVSNVIKDAFKSLSSCPASK
ncbi:esterase/lipase/thioesterase domain-containing protein [Heterostelium album PN500]|uniref:Esterase/lipase/thioesterase domain-containing protein n=1 Tax=Heterostelium pallidum (strain ATCC 26659 / Pp 5 / PN500) TaxID=670386 RepID=D3BDK1_HETP5|nr:esterase/lipase/thioesterase domain-containing protein [Heterostelium album PN500]EFA79982.1 esterase/lipase/thioesterase domain-containing protein [Heterostelium album PN500]|eukprot:XP_020432102.1 esterase/lipase/thioesterase domain-containing protein [Heterostelium album PN500]